MPRSPLSILAALLLATFWTSSVASADEPLRFSFRVGQEVPYTLIQDMKMTMDAGPAGVMKTKTNQTIKMAWRVEEVKEDGSAVMTHDVQRVQMSLAGPLGQGYEFDTDSQQAPQGLAAMIAPIFKALVESDYKVTMTPRGEISDMVIPEAVMEALKNVPGAGGAAPNDESIKQMAMQVAIQLPKEALVDGKTWSTKVQTSAPMFGQQQVETTYEYEGTREKDGRKLEVFSPTVVVTTIAQDKEGNMSAKLDSGESSGEILFDREMGRLVSSQITQNLDIEIQAGVQTITGTIVQTATIKSGEQTEQSDSEAQSAEPVGAAN